MIINFDSKLPSVRLFYTVWIFASIFPCTINLACVYSIPKFNLTKNDGKIRALTLRGTKSP